MASVADFILVAGSMFAGIIASIVHIIHAPVMTITLHAMLALAASCIQQLSSWGEHAGKHRMNCSGLD